METKGYKPVTPGAPSRQTVLVVEDDKAIRTVTVRFLAQEGFDVLEADSAERAEEIWKQHGTWIDLMLTDVVIPYRATGVQLAKKFREDKPNLQVVFTSGFSPEMAADDDLSPGDTSFLAKPYTPVEVVQFVKKRLQRRQA